VAEKPAPQALRVRSREQPRVHIHNKRNQNRMQQCVSPRRPLSAKIKVSNIVPRGSAVLIYTLATGDQPVKFSAPEFLADVPVQGHEMYAQKVLACETFEIQFLGYRDNL
jgi:hypothetical protein